MQTPASPAPSSPWQHCQQCNAPITGRVDKKFCSDQCRSTYNNRLGGTASEYMRRVRDILRKNRAILSRLHQAGKLQVNTQQLAALGFNFQYFTSTTRIDRRQVYFCYEHGYAWISKRECIIVVMKDLVIV